MYGIKHTVSVQQVAISAIQDLWEGLLAADHIIIPLELGFSQNSDAGDAEAELLHCSLRRVTGAPTSGSGGTTPTPQVHESHFPASGVTWEANNTTQLTGGTNVVLRPFDINIQLPEVIIPLAESRYIFSPSQRILVELETAPADAITFTQWITYMEIGG